MKPQIIIFFLISVFIVSFTSAEEPETKAEQCATYGSYQDEEGNWQTCEPDDIPNEID